MGSQNHQQAYPYTLKTVAASETASGLVCADRFFMYIVPPKNALTIERLFCHFVMVFDAGIAVADRVIESIGIVDELRPFPQTAEANYQRRQAVNLVADSSRRVNLSIDLTHLLKHDNVAYEESLADPSSIDTGFTAVEIKLPISLASTTTIGVVELWKIDALFTTTGIR